MFIPPDLPSGHTKLTAILSHSDFLSDKCAECPQCLWYWTEYYVETYIKYSILDTKWVGKPFKSEEQSKSESESDQCGHFLHITMKPTLSERKSESERISVSSVWSDGYCSVTLNSKIWLVIWLVVFQWTNSSSIQTILPLFSIIRFK